MSRARNNGRGNNRRGRSRSRSRAKDSKPTKSEDKPKKTLSDHMYHVGSSKNASDCVTNTKFILNYIEMNYTEGLDLTTALKNKKDFDFDAIEPKMKQSTKDPSTEEAAYKTELEQFKLEFQIKFEKFDERVNQYRRNKSAAAALLWKQCSSGMRTKLQARTDWDKVEKDPILLLQAMHEHSMSYESTQYKMKTVVDAVKNFISTRQKHGETLDEYLARFKASRDVLLSHVGKNLDKLVKEAQGYQAAVASQQAEELYKLGRVVLEEVITYLFMTNADQNKYGSLMARFNTSNSLGDVEYPKTVLKAHSVLGEHTWDKDYADKNKKQKEKKNDKKTSKKDEENPSMSFAQFSKTKCYCCGKNNHDYKDCSKRSTTNKNDWWINKQKDVQQYNQIISDIKTMMNTEANSTSTTTQDEAGNTSAEASWISFHFSGHQQNGFRNTIVLDSGSSVDLFCNEGWLKNVQNMDSPHQVHTNGGSFKIQKEGLLPQYGEVPLDPKAMTNIFSLGVLSDKYRVTMDTAKENAFFVHTPTKIVKFARNDAKLYTHVPTELNKPKSPSGVDPKKTKTVSFAQSVEENKLFYTPREVKKAKTARDLLAALGSPSISDLKKIISMNAIANLPVKTEDIDLAEKIYGPDIGILKGKTIRKNPVPLVTSRIEIPPEIYEERSSWELCVDVMFVNKMPFITSITKKLFYRTAEFLMSRSKEDLYKGLDKILGLYNASGFSIDTIYADREFKAVMDEIKDELQVQMVYSAAQGHVPEIERTHRVYQERIRASFHRLPFKALPILVLKVLVMESARKLNFFPAKNGISQYYSPRQIVHRETLDYEKDCKYYLGQYVQAHDDPNPKNTQDPRTIDCLYLRPGNSGHDLYNISTGELINRDKVTPLPFTKSVIDAVNKIAAKQGQKGLRLTSLHDDVLYDSSWTAGVDYDEDTDEEYDSDEEDSDIEDDDDDTQTTESTSSTESQSSDDSEEARDILYEEEDPVQPNTAPQDQQEESEEEEDPQDNPGGELRGDLEALQAEPRRSARQSKPPTTLVPTMTGKSHEDSQVHLIIPEEEAQVYEPEFARYAVMLLQHIKEKVNMTRPKPKLQSHLVNYSLKKGLKKFGSKGYDAALGEMKQLHDRDCWTPIKLQTMSKSERDKALESLIFLVEKKDGRIKARHCANGSKQRQWMRPDEAASPTVMTESVLLTAAIEAKEKRDVATWDIPNAFIQTAVDELDKDGDRIIMKIRGPMVNMLLDIDDNYKEFVVEERGHKVLYVHILRAIYGMLMSGLLFYKKFKKAIEARGYKVNPYDPCVANKMINGKQHTISWHVDDLKASHVDPKVNDNFEEWLQKEFGQIKAVTGTRGKKHVYLGMTLDYSTPGEVKVDMVNYVKEMIEDFPEELNGKVATVSNQHLFDTTRGKKLGEAKKEAFHAIVAKALFLTMRSRPDIRLAVAFLCTRVTEPTTYDWFKLQRMMNFLYKTQTECLTLALDDSKKVTWSVDAAFAVHPDMKSHSGMTMSLGKGAITSLSRKQKLNTRSSTEAELVAVDDCMAQVLWTKYFLEEQGYDTKAHILLQDNQSAIKLEKNGHKSMGQRSRHIKIRYFFITDQIQKGNVQVEYCPTDQIAGDYMSKPLQGHKFEGFRRTIMNLPTEESARVPRVSRKTPPAKAKVKAESQKKRVTFD